MLTPLPEGLLDEATPEMMVKLFYGSHIDPALAYLMTWRAAEVDWESMETSLETPFCWYQFKTGYIANLPQMEERETHFDHKNKNDPLDWWRIRVWRAVRPEYKTTTRGDLMTYTRAKTVIDNYLRSVGRLNPTGPRHELMEIEPQEVVETALQQQEVEGETAWLERALDALRPTLREYNVHDPRTAQELVDLIRGEMARKQQYRTELETASTTNNELNERIRSLEDQNRTATDKLRAEEGIVGRLRAKIQTLQTEKRTISETAQANQQQLQRTLDDSNQRRSQDRTDHQTQVAGLELRIRQLTAARAEAESQKVRELEAALQAQRTINNNLTTENTERRTEVEQLQENVRNNQERLNRTEASLTEWRTVGQHLYNDVIALEERERELLAVTGTLEGLYAGVNGNTNVVIEQLCEIAQTIAAGERTVRAAADTLTNVNRRRIGRTVDELPAGNGGLGEGGGASGGAGGGAGGSAGGDHFGGFFFFISG